MKIGSVKATLDSGA